MGNDIRVLHITGDTGRIALDRLLVEGRFARGAGDARRLIVQGVVRVDGSRCCDLDHVVPVAAGQRIRVKIGGFVQADVAVRNVAAMERQRSTSTPKVRSAVPGAERHHGHAIDAGPAGQ